MVKIIDGEIVADDDPRVTGRAVGPAGGGATAAPPRQQGGPGPAPGPAAQGGSVFNFSAPVLSMVPGDGQGIGGIPNFRLFGALVRAEHALALAAAAVFVGIRGVVVGAIIW